MFGHGLLPIFVIRSAAKRLTGGQAANHGAEPRADGGQRAGVATAFIHAGVVVQKGAAGHAHVIKPDAAIVHTVEALQQEKSDRKCNETC